MRTTTFISGCTLKIKCVHGFFTIDETSPGEIARFADLFAGLEIVSFGESFTFADLVDVPEYTIKGGELFDLVASATIADTPGEIFRANKIVYDFNAGLFKPITSIRTIVEIDQGSSYYLSPGLILPGSLTDGGKRVTDYAAWYLFGEGQFKYSSIEVSP